MTNPKSKLRKTTPRAKKSLGQNFLVDTNYVDKIISVLNPQKDEVIIEIGPGRGALTAKLIERAGKVIAIEIDRDLSSALRAEFAKSENFVLIEKDALEVDFQALVTLQGSPIKTKLVANLPYYISTAILQHLINCRAAVPELVLMLQKEVVDRITAKAGSTDRGFLTVLVEAYFNSEKVFDVPGNAFSPIPKVTSSVIRLLRKDESPAGEAAEVFRELVSQAFRHKRKTILNNLKSADGILKSRIEGCGGAQKVLHEAGIESRRRAEAIELTEWIRLVDAIAN